MKQSHDQVVKTIFKYFKGTSDYGLWYKKNCDFILKAYIDVDWVECVDDRRSTSGGAFFSRDGLVSWLSKKQDLVSLSAT